MTKMDHKANAIWKRKFDRNYYKTVDETPMISIKSSLAYEHPVILTQTSLQEGFFKVTGRMKKIGYA